MAVTFPKVFVKKWYHHFLYLAAMCGMGSNVESKEEESVIDLKGKGRP